MCQGLTQIWYFRMYFRTWQNNGRIFLASSLVFHVWYLLDLKERRLGYQTLKIKYCWVCGSCSIKIMKWLEKSSSLNLCKLESRRKGFSTLCVMPTFRLIFYLAARWTLIWLELLVYIDYNSPKPFPTVYLWIFLLISRILR